MHTGSAPFCLEPRHLTTRAEASKLDCLSFLDPSLSPSAAPRALLVQRLGLVAFHYLHKSSKHGGSTTLLETWNHPSDTFIDLRCWSGALPWRLPSPNPGSMQASHSTQDITRDKGLLHAVGGAEGREGAPGLLESSIMLPLLPFCPILSQLEHLFENGALRHLAHYTGMALQSFCDAPGLAFARGAGTTSRETAAQHL